MRILRSEWFWAAILFLAGVLICLLLGFNGLYGQDAYEYERFAAELRSAITHSTPPGEFFWPVNFPLLGALLSFPLGTPAIALQCISLASHVLTFVIVVRILRRFAPGLPQAQMAFAFVAVGLSPILLRHAPLVMADSLGMMCLTAGFWFALAHREGGKAIHALMAAVALGMAFMTRYAAAVPALVPATMVALQMLRRRQWLLLPCILLVASAVLLPHLLLRSESPAAFTGHAWLSGWHPANFFRRAFTTPDGTQHFAAPNAVFILFSFIHPGYFLLGGPLLLFLRRSHFRNVTWRLLALGGLLYLFFLGGIPYQNIRFLSLCFPLFAVLLWWPFHEMMQTWLKRPSWQMALLGAGILCQMALAVMALRPMARQVRLEREVAKALEALPPGRLYTFSWEGMIRYREIPQQVVSIFDHEVKGCEEGALLLQPEVVATQWKGRNPERNWNFLRDHCILIPMKDFDQGWKLFRVNALVHDPAGSL